MTVKRVLLDNRVINLEHISKASFSENGENVYLEVNQPTLMVYTIGHQAPEVFVGDAALQLWVMLKASSLHLMPKSTAMN